MKSTMIRSLAIGGTVLLGTGNALAITTDDTLTAENLVNTMLGSNSSIIPSNIKLTCAPSAFGKFGDGNAAVGIAEGIILSTGKIANVIGPNNSDEISVSNGSAGDADLSNLIGQQQTNDACVLEFDFKLAPTLGLINASVAFNYAFASDEYNEYVDQFNDVFAFFVDGKNIALIPGTTTPVSIDNVNKGDYSEFYINNDDCQANPASCPVPDTQMDGLTTVLSTAEVEILPKNSYHVKLAIADAKDLALDSNVFIESGSFKIVSNNPPVAECKNAELILDSNGTAVLTPSQVDNGSSDPDNDPITYSLSKTNFSCPDVGVQNFITLTATDDKGASDSCIATVTTVDKVAPAVKTKNITVPLDASGKASIGASDVDGGSTDNCCIASRSVSKSSFTCADIGQQSVTLTVTDCNGNTSSAPATVTVQDNIAPVVTTKLAIVQSSTTKFVFTATAKDNCSAAVKITTDYSCSQSKSCMITQSGNTLAIASSGGVNNNTAWTIVAKDKSGNTTIVKGP